MTPARKAALVRYSKSPNGRATQARYRDSSKGRINYAAYYAANRERIIARARAYYYADEERRNRISRRNTKSSVGWKKRNRDKINARYKTLRLANPERSIIIQLRGRLRRKLGVEPPKELVFAWAAFDKVRRLLCQ